MTWRYTVQIIAILLALAAGGISYGLLQEHLTGSSGLGWFDNFCGSEPEPTATTAPDESAAEDADSEPEQQHPGGEEEASTAEDSSTPSDSEDTPLSSPAEDAATPAPPESLKIAAPETEGDGQTTSTPPESAASATSDASGSAKSKRDCGEVLKSDYGVWPPRKPDEPEGTGHIPVAFVGMLYYSFLAIWLIGVGSPSRERYWVHCFPLGMAAVGLLGSAGFTYIMFTETEAWCPWCLVTHILNLLMALCLVLLWPKRLPQAQLAPPGSRADANDLSTTDAEGEEEATTEAASRSTMAVTPARLPLSRPHPTFRQVLATVLALLLAFFGLTALLGFQVQKQLAVRTTAQLLDVIERMKGDGQKMLRRYQREEKFEITLRDDDPLHPSYQPGERAVKVVVFSDFQCPHCGKVAEFLDKEVPPLFDNHVRMVFKHYPMNKDCNGNLSNTLHKYSCYTSALAEAARMQGGNEAFWQAHDYLFEHRRDVQNLNIAPFSEALGLDPEQIKKDMNSKEAAKRIWEDVNAGKACKIRGTPSVFVSGRKVDSTIVREIEFWDTLADQYFRALNKPRPEHTKRPRIAVYSR